MLPPSSHARADAPPQPQHECHLLGPFALVVQLALGGLALLALVFKRWRERPQRPLKIWAFDVSKQVVGSVMLHGANLLMSMLSSGQFSVQAEGDADEDVPNPCSFYFLNLLIDTTIGIPILILLLHFLTTLFLRTSLGDPPESLESGYYSTPPRATWWAKQSLVYFLGLLGMKFVVLLIFLVFPFIGAVGDWALGWTEGNARLQVFFVMLFFPVVMNATQYYIIDTFIKGKADDAARGVPVPVGADSDSESDDDAAEGLLVPYDEVRDAAHVGGAGGGSAGDGGDAAARMKRPAAIEEMVSESADEDGKPQQRWP